ncbi:MAG: 3-oxoacyl-ACP reductase FabG [Spirochaetia bacterium]|nr:3-oxoacyl-ACP reductase FabG [Spirochaetia bacterium]
MEKKTVLVTGAGRGIGRAIALSAAEAGYNVIAHYNKSGRQAEKLVEDIRSGGGMAELIQFDIADREDCRIKLGNMIAVHGAPWGVVCNAGICHDNTFVALSYDDWDSVINTNLNGFFNVLNPLVMAMCRKKQGRIVTVASVSGLIGNRGQVNYSASKAGIIGATKALATELASRSITVNCVAPGVIDTDMTRELPVERIVDIIPMRRVGKPEEVAAAVLFLLSDNSSYITRQVISVNGGMI